MLPHGLPSTAATTSATERYGPRFLRNALYGVMAPLVSMLIRIGFVGYVVRCLGQEKFGLVTLGLSIQYTLMIFRLSTAAGIGKKLNTCMTRCDMEGFQKHYSVGVVLAVANAVLVATAVGLLLTIFWGFFNIPNQFDMEGRVMVITFGINGIVLTLLGPFSACLYAAHRMDIQQKLLAAALMLRMGITVALFELYGSTVQGYAFILLLCSIGELVGMSMWVRLRIPEARFRFSMTTWPAVRKLATFNLLIAGNNMMQSLFLSLPAILILRYGGLAAAGQFGIGHQIGMFAWSIAAQLNSAISPVVVALWAEKSQQLKLLWQLLMKTYLALAGLLWLCFVFLIPILMNLWLKNDTDLLIEARYWVFGATFLAVINLINGPFLLSYEKLKLPFISGLVLGGLMLVMMPVVCRREIVNILLPTTFLIFVCYGLYVSICLSITMSLVGLGMGEVLMRTILPVLLPWLGAACVLLVGDRMKVLCGWGGIIGGVMATTATWLIIFSFGTLSVGDRARIRNLLRRKSISGAS